MSKLRSLTLIYPAVFEVVKIDGVLIDGVEAARDPLQRVGNVSYQLAVIGVGFCNGKGLNEYNSVKLSVNELELNIFVNRSIRSLQSDFLWLPGRRYNAKLQNYFGTLGFSKTAKHTRSKLSYPWLCFGRAVESYIKVSIVGFTLEKTVLQLMLAALVTQALTANDSKFCSHK